MIIIIMIYVWHAYKSKLFIIIYTQVYYFPHFFLSSQRISLNHVMCASSQKYVFLSIIYCCIKLNVKFWHGTKICGKSTYFWAHKSRLSYITYSIEILMTTQPEPLIFIYTHTHKQKTKRKPTNCIHVFIIWTMIQITYAHEFMKILCHFSSRIHISMISCL